MAARARLPADGAHEDDEQERAHARDDPEREELGPGVQRQEQRDEDEEERDPAPHDEEPAAGAPSLGGEVDGVARAELLEHAATAKGSPPRERSEARAGAMNIGWPPTPFIAQRVRAWEAPNLS